MQIRLHCRLRRSSSRARPTLQTLLILPIKDGASELVVSATDMDALLLGALVALLVALSAYHSRRNRFPLPPGPKGLPIVGNAWDLPGDGREWLTYQRWSHEYSTDAPMMDVGMLLISALVDSDVLHLRLSGRSIVILNSAKAAIELLEKRSSIYSDRYDNS